MIENLPIDMELLEKRKAIPVKLAELSYIDQEKAIHFLRIWGEKKSPITPLYNEIMKTLYDKELIEGGA
ncbi:hypothetical protein [Metabacillus litoralis]|uniref:hypothetical protein n=1 Tax=Metabacillus litoralis TaxID=152268 RepID=UPI00203F9FD4|nr:hypothetical protein [Metabacillus litoralis]MCM3413565.1 hypothetical protein [Metabacillus litoralis]